jgi:hypothetical protein
MQFIIVNVNDSFKPVLDAYGMPMVFHDGKAAADFAAFHSEITGKKHQPRPRLTASDWHARERQRFEDGSYLLPLFVKCDWYKPVDGHFLHVSKNKPDMVAYTACEEDGLKDRQVRLTVGRYLTRFFPTLLANEVQRCASEHHAHFVEDHVLFATTEEEIEWVFRHGPGSCMTHPVEEYSSHYNGKPYHPVRVYAGPDTAVAYIKNLDERVTARSVVWPKRKVYTRLYGDETRLATALDKLGYDEGDLDGARLLLRRDSRRSKYVITPYVDSVEYAKIEGDYLVLDTEGDITMRNTSGISEADGVTCDCCERSVRRGDTYTVYSSERQAETWCDDCRMEDAVYSDYHCYYYESDAVEEWNGDYYLHDWLASNTFVSDRSDERYSLDSRVEVLVRNHAGNIVTEEWSDDEANEHAVECDFSGYYYDEDEIVYVEETGQHVGSNLFERYFFNCDECGTDMPRAEKSLDETDCCCKECASDRSDRRKQATLDLMYAFLPFTPALPAPSAHR